MSVYMYTFSLSLSLSLFAHGMVECYVEFTARVKVYQFLKLWVPLPIHELQRGYCLPVEDCIDGMSRYPSSTLLPFLFWVSLLKLNSRKKGSLSINGLLGNIDVAKRHSLEACLDQHTYNVKSHHMGRGCINNLVC